MHACDVCGKSFSTKPQLNLHKKQHQYPCIRMYRKGQARMLCTAAAKAAEAAARKAGGEMWRGQLIITFSLYTWQSFRWLLENDVGWVAWILSEFIHQGELNEQMKWQKECLLEYVKDFPSVTCLVEEKLKAVRKGNEELYAQHMDEQMVAFLKPSQIKSYVRRIVRGVEETAAAVHAIIEEFKGPAGLDIDGIHLFKSSDTVDAHWATASKHLGCMQVGSFLNGSRRVKVWPYC
ncbi:hypothetical protein ACEWY4_003448 [Coilia grayii]|uniref:C2H2-type domain-containing protein n=1 Tax=Coilia grayii TaxID=363190 RepID=A0ABD1KRC4_9TELE